MIHRLMTEHEKADITVRSCILMDEGKEDEGIALLKTTPMPPFLAKIIKEKMGLAHLIDQGWNMAEVEAKFGPDWLTQ